MATQNTIEFPKIVNQIYGKALYYPYIEIQNVNWLKMALLYWDGIRRIVPGSIVPNDLLEIRQVVDAELLIDTAPERYLEKASDFFLQGQLKNISDNSSGFDLLNDFMVKTSRKVPSPQKISAQNLSVELKLDKVSHALISHLVRNSLAEIRGDNLIVSRTLGGLYMTCLATLMAEEIGASLVAEDKTFGEVQEYIDFGQSNRKNSTSNHELDVILRLGVNFPSPADLSSVSMSRIIDFNQRRSGEMKHFRQMIELVVKEAATITDPNCLADFFSEKAKALKEATDNHRKALDELHVASASSLLQLSAPALFTAAAASLEIPPVAAVLAGTGLAVSGVVWWATVRGDRRQAIQESPYHYLLSLEKLA